MQSTVRYLEYQLIRFALKQKSEVRTNHRLYSKQSLEVRDHPREFRKGQLESDAGYPQQSRNKWLQARPPLLPG